MKEIDPDEIGEQLRRTERRIRETVRGAMLETALRSEPLVVQATPANSGMTRAAWRVEQTLEGADLVNDAPHAGVLELGSRPHRPPLLPILQWVVSRLGGGHVEHVEDASDEHLAIAWAVVRAIEEKGTKPHYMVRDALPEMERILARVLRRRLRELKP